MAVYSFSQVVSLIRRAVLAEKALAELTLDYQLLLQANEGIVDLQAQRLATARMQFDSIAEAARACADAKGLDP